jgi:hypothetical protein
MTAKDLISGYLLCDPQTLNVSLCYVAERLPQAKLRSGHKVFSVEDVALFLEECADEYRMQAFPDWGKEGAVHA